MIAIDTWSLLRTRWIVLIASVLLGSILGSIYVMLSSREYTASTKILVSTDTGGNGSDLAQGGTFAQQQARNFSNIATSEVVLEPVITALGLDTSVAALARKVSTNIPLNTSIIEIDVTDPSPARSAAIANAATTSLANSGAALTPPSTGGGTPVELQIVQTAVAPSRPSTPNAPVSIVVGALIGFLIAVGYVLIRSRVSSRVRTLHDVQRITTSTVLGWVRREVDPTERPILTGAADRSVRAEEFRQLRTSLQFLQMDSPRKAFAITSSMPREGKSTIAVNIASAIAAVGKSVCLVEADLRRPSLGNYLGLEGGVGLTTVLAGDVSVHDALQSWGAYGLQVLLSGQLPPNPSELLSTQAAADLLEDLRGRFDVLIIDTPPLVPVTDSTIIGHLLDGVILVIGLGVVRSQELRSSVDALMVARTPILGTILNFAESGPRSTYAEPYGGHEPDAIYTADSPPELTGSAETNDDETTVADTNRDEAESTRPTAPTPASAKKQSSVAKTLKARGALVRNDPSDDDVLSVSRPNGKKGLGSPESL